MLAIIGGTGLSALEDFEARRIESLQSPYQDSPVLIQILGRGRLEFAFLPRHGTEHSIPPHRINYRANVQALKTTGVQNIIAVNVVGGIHSRLSPGSLAIPDQIIDYSYGRAHTFFDGAGDKLVHVEFTKPYSDPMRKKLMAACQSVNKDLLEPRRVLDSGVYGCTQGPRLETAAEIFRLRRDGCDMVGMTGMPEAVLARELEMDYACLALSVNWAAGLDVQPISLASMQEVIVAGMDFVRKVLQEYLR